MSIIWYYDLSLALLLVAAAQILSNELMFRVFSELCSVLFLQKKKGGGKEKRK